MCQAGKTYMVPYKGILVPIRLEAYCKVYGFPEYNMFIGKKFIGRHWCVHRSFYKTSAECIGSEKYKITRALNMQRFNASRLKGNALKNVFRTEYQVKIP